MKFLYRSLFILMTIAFVSCGKDSLNVPNENNYDTQNNVVLKQIEDFYYLGDIHNEYMQNLASNFKGIEGVYNEDAIAYVNEVNLGFTPNDQTLNDEIKAELENLPLGLEVSYLAEPQEEFILSDEVQNKINELLEAEILDEWEAGMINEFIAFTQENSTFEELESFLDEKILEWNEQGYVANTNDGDISGVFLAISIKSTEWWLDNPEYIYQPESRIPVWFLADAVGAIGSGLVADHFGASDSGVIGAMVAGAITGSTGIVKKVAGWLHTLLIP